MNASILIIPVLIFFYFFPFILAHSRRHHQTVAIFMLTLLLGWSILGWIIALVWASTAVRRQQPAI